MRHVPRFFCGWCFHRFTIFRGSILHRIRRFSFIWNSCTDSFSACRIVAQSLLWASVFFVVLNLVRALCTKSLRHPFLLIQFRYFYQRRHLFPLSFHPLLLLAFKNLHTLAFLRYAMMLRHTASKTWKIIKTVEKSVENRAILEISRQKNQNILWRYIFYHRCHRLFSLSKN